MRRIKKVVNIISLEEKAREANKAYRVGSPIMDDSEYDQLIDEIKNIDPDNEFVNSVEPEIKGSRKEFKHKVKMLSMSKVYTIGGISKWFEDIEKLRIKIGIKTQVKMSISTKLDGIAAKYYKKEDIFVTRGDGEVGLIIPKHISDHIKRPENVDSEISGELMVSNQYFNTVLSEEYSHPRNFTVGIIGSDNPSQSAKVALELGAIEFIPHEKQHWSKWVDSDLEIENIEHAVNQIKKIDLFSADGIVFSCHNKEIRSEMGSTEHHYRWQIALKENAQGIKTTVIKETYQVGRTGTITPVLEIQPIKISGATISKVTAHNIQWLIDNGCGAGSTVKIVRSGEVIPKIECVVTPKPVNVPRNCPSCGSLLVRDGLFLKCIDKFCPEQTVQKISHWFKCLNSVDWFGPKTIRKIVEEGIDSIDSFYRISEEYFQSMGFGDVQARNLKEALDKSITSPTSDWRFLSAFGISFVEKGSSKKILKEFNIKELPNLKVSDILDIEGFGEKTSEAFIDWFKDNSELFQKMLDLNFNIVDSKSLISSKTCKFTGKKIVFTGTVNGMNRDEVKEFAEKHGIISQSGVSKSTDYLVTGEGPGESKVSKAKSLGVEIMDSENFLEEMKL